ncbi:MaoC family dehydratase [Pseudomonas poae]|uniref:Beta-methylmalyl-CoA dehydratase n=2 Tax=Pseudomonas poae TaxID=200451 RepID=A0AAP2WK04_9PSED|nr:MaoC family dehydratase [Pseudomonas poae]KTC40766.1 dehydratase [Pseudomonas sp. ABAC21]MCF5658128.1 hypothetical protein [Pseudomonas poae]NMZ52543.1 MaoC family dehydratase [Pseudomonas poae]HCY91577.1 hypothetical protein [Escherichia coli]
MSKVRQGNFFEDFSVGMHIQHPTPRTLTEGDRSLYIGLTGSRDAIGSAETVSAALGFEKRPMEDFLVFNIAFGKTVPDISLNAIANLGYADVRFVRPVYAQDTLRVSSDVIGLRETSNGKAGIVYTRSVATNQRNEEVLTWVRWVMIHKRNKDGVSGINVIPSLPQEVAVQHFQALQVNAAAEVMFEATRSHFFWEDYSAGERIDHMSAMTINDSDHSQATRLYQNTAKAHFDAYTMAASGMQQRLVYGGHVISLCKALSYDGLENAICVLAMNGGSHVSPTFSGDTLVCATQIKEQIELGHPHIGALRLRLIAAKNIGVASKIIFTEKQQGKIEYPPEVVLDLDYVIAIPKKPNNKV